MRIAISGAHHVGKSTLVAELAAALANHDVVEEPYLQLEEEGHEFAETPSIEDFILQLDRSLESLSGDEPNVIFDRCPADLLAYLATHDDADMFEIADHLPRAREAIRRLDLVVFVPVEEPDRIVLPRDVDLDWRARVNEDLGELLRGDARECEVDVLEVTGSVRERVRTIIAHMRKADR